MVKTGMDNVLGVSLRQRMTSDSILGRMDATFRFLLTGALAVGAAIAGLVGELTSVRNTLWLGAAFLVTAFLPVFLSPLRSRRDLPREQDGRRATPPSHLDSREAARCVVGPDRIFRAMAYRRLTG